jgi:uncharacterized protein (TIGR03382 family)
MRLFLAEQRRRAALEAVAISLCRRVRALQSLFEGAVAGEQLLERTPLRCVVGARGEAAHRVAGPAGRVVAVAEARRLIIGYVSWMQPATTFGALLILLLAWLLPRRRMDT